MYFGNTIIQELNESSANFDPILNQDMCRLISFNESSAQKRSRKKEVAFALATHDLDEFELALS
jgi:hypothetical protein